MSEVAALVLAAGQGDTLREDAQAPRRASEGKPLVRMGRAGCAPCLAQRPVIVVTGHRAEADRGGARADLAVEFAHNPVYAEGLSTSLKAGFAALPEDAEAAVVLLGDMPLVGSGVIDRLVAAWRASGRPSALVPVSRAGGPTLWCFRAHSRPTSWRSRATSGAGPLLRRRDDVAEYPLEDPALLQDVDTPDVLADARSAGSSEPFSGSPRGRAPARGCSSR